MTHAFFHPVRLLLLAALSLSLTANADHKHPRLDGGPEKVKPDCTMMKDGKPCDDACMKQCAEKGGCKLHEHGGQGCPMMKDGKPCDDACRKACADKGGCPLHGDKGGAMHGEHGCPMLKDGKPCDDACMKHCAEKGGCGMHEHGGCPMMKDGKPCDDACMKACAEKGGCKMHGAGGCPMHGESGGCPMMKDGKPCDDACMKACAEKGGCKMHEHGGCPMMKDGKACDENCMKHCAEKGGCGMHGDHDCPMMKDGKPCEHDCPMHGAADRPEDRAAITATALDYAEGWYAGDADRMGRALHPALAKRMVHADEKGASVLHQMDKEKLVAGTRAGGGSKTPADRQKKDVRILDLYGNAAVVKLAMSDWVDYLEVAKFDGRWVIVNVLWERNPKSPS